MNELVPLKVVGRKNLSRLLDAISTGNPFAMTLRYSSSYEIHLEDVERIAFEFESIDPTWYGFEVQTPARAAAHSVMGPEAAANLIVALTQSNGAYNFYVWTDDFHAQKPANERSFTVEVSDYNKEADDRFKIVIYE